MKVLITGCARSGTTLMTHLMRYFYNCKVVIENEAHPFDYEKYNHKDHVLVIKKPAVMVRDIDYVSPYSLVNDWKIIWMVRDGRDVICSTNERGHYHVGHERWIESNMNVLPVLMEPSVQVIKYEMLVSRPESQMNKVSRFIGQDYQEDFRSFYTGMNEHDPMNTGIVPREMSTDSIGNWKNPVHKKVIDKAMENSKFTKLLTIFGYDNH